MEGFVCIEKQEKLSLLKLENHKFKELVLSDTDPYPGYYSVTPVASEMGKPKYVFVAMKQGEGCYEDLVLRAACKIKKETNFEFDANYGRISLHNKIKPSLRIKIEDLSKVPELLSAFKTEGLRFESTSKTTPYVSTIKVRKFMTFSQYSKGIYSGDKKDHYYIQVSKKIEWKDFEKIIPKIKSSGTFGVFDAALTSLYLKDEIVEFIRIFTKSFKEKDFVKLRDEILKQID